MGTITKTLRGVGAGTATITATDGTEKNTVTAEVECEATVTGSFNTHHEGAGTYYGGRTGVITFTYTSPDPSNPVDPTDISLNIVGDTNHEVTIENRQNASGSIEFQALYNPPYGKGTPGTFQIQAVYNGVVLDTMNYYAIDAHPNPAYPDLEQEETVSVVVNYTPTTIPYEHFFCTYTDSEGNLTFNYSSDTPGVLNLDITDHGGETIIIVDVWYSEMGSHDRMIQGEPVTSISCS